MFTNITNRINSKNKTGSLFFNLDNVGLYIGNNTNSINISKYCLSINAIKKSDNILATSDYVRNLVDPDLNSIKTVINNSSLIFIINYIFYILILTKLHNISDDLTKVNSIPNSIKYKVINNNDANIFQKIYYIIDNEFNIVTYEIINDNITFNNNITNAIIIYD